MRTPEVSVVLSVYNAADTLLSTLESVLQQEDVDSELVIVDDGSSDETPRLLQRYEPDPRVRIVRQQNAGLTLALIRGCAEAAGRYIARQDAGDRSAPRRLSLQKRALDADPDLAFVSCWTEFAGPELEPLFVQKGTGAAARPTHILADQHPKGVIDGPTHHGSVMFRRDAYLRVGGYRPQFYYGQDWDLWYRLAETGKFQLLEETLYVARLGRRDISALHRGRQQQVAKLSREALRRRRRREAEADVLEEASRIVSSRSDELNPAGVLYFVGECLRRRGDQRSMRYFREAITADPLHLRSWVRLAQMKLTGR